MAALGLALAFLSRRGEAMRNASDFERIDELLNRGRLERSRAALRGIRSVDATVRRVVESIVTRMRRRSRSEEHTSELQSLMRISYAVFCLKKKNTNKNKPLTH